MEAFESYLQAGMVHCASHASLLIFSSVERHVPVLGTKHVNMIKYDTKKTSPSDSVASRSIPGPSGCILTILHHLDQVVGYDN